MNEIQVDFRQIKGKIKPMHAVNNVPCVPYDNKQNNLFVKMQEAGIPYARLHDTGGRYGGAHYVDVGNVFPNFDANPNEPSAYDFAFTDRLLEEITKYGMKPFFRLGSTIENFHFIKAYQIYPPKDFQKWAEICAGIIRHYNEGWADGFRLGIEHWEIWNEPDNAVTIEENPMWKGAPEEFYEFYCTVSKYLKQQFPNIKVGGYGSCGFYAVSNADFSEVARSTSRVEYFIEYLNGFLEYSRANGGILDFFSWHSYADVTDNVKYAEYARQKLDSFGYRETEIYLDEWNPGVEQKGLLRDAANIAAGMCLMQETPTDMCMYYDAQITSELCGMFDFVAHDVYKAYYAFYAFHKLYVLGREATSNSNMEGVYCCAATDGKSAGILIVNRTAEEAKFNLVLQGADVKDAVCYAVDEEHDFQKNRAAFSGAAMPANAIWYIHFSKTDGEA